MLHKLFIFQGNLEVQSESSMWIMAILDNRSGPIKSAPMYLKSFLKLIFQSAVWQFLNIHEFNSSGQTASADRGEYHRLKNKINTVSQWI